MANVAKLKEKARSFEQGEQWQRALEAYREALELARGEASEIGLWNRVGDLEQRLGRPDRAVEAFETGASAYVEAGLYNNAIALCNKILRVLPGRAEVYLRLGQISAAQGFLADARANFLQYAERMQRAGELDASFAALREFAALSPHDTETRQLLAEQLAAHERPAEAVEQFRLLHGQLRRAGRDAEAEAVRERIRALDPDAVVDAQGAAAPSPAPGELLDLDVLPTFSLAGRDTDARDVVDDAAPELDDGFALQPIVDVQPDAAPAEPSSPIEPLDLTPIAGLEPHAGLAPAADDGDVLPLEPDFGIAPLEPAGFETSHAGPGEPAADEGLDDGALPLLGMVDGDASLLDIETSPGSDVGADPARAEPAEEPRLPLLDFVPPTEEPRADDAGLDFEIEPLTDLEPAAADAYDGVPEPAGEEPGARGELAAGSPAWAEPEPESEPDGLTDTEELEELELVALPRWDVEPELEPEPDALEVARAQLDAHPADAEARQRAVALLRERGLDAEAVALLSGLHERLAANGEFLPASDVARQLLALTPRDTALYQKSVEYAFRSGERDRLIAAYLELGDHLRGGSNPDKARVVYQRVLDLDPGNQAARAAIEPPRPAPPADYVDLGALILDEADAEPTTRFVVDAEEPTGNEDEDFAKMLSHFRQKVSENIATEDSASHYDLGVAFKEMGLLDEAIAQFQVALRGGAHPLATLEILGECFIEKGQLTLATRVLERAMQLPGASEADLLGVHYLLSRCDEAQGRAGRAQELLERVLAVDIGFRDGAARLRALRARSAG